MYSPGSPQDSPYAPRRGSSRVRPDVSDLDVSDPDDPESVDPAYNASTPTSRSRSASPDLPAPVRGAGRGRGRPRSRRGRGRVAVNRDLAATHAPQSAAPPPPAAHGRGRGRGRAAAAGRGRGRVGAAAAQLPVEQATATTPQGPRRGLVRPYPDMSPNEIRSYKRARGDVCEQGAFIKLIDRAVLSKDNDVLWEPQPPQGVDAIIDPQSIGPGGPTDRVALATTPEQLFSSFFPDDLIEMIVQRTNKKAFDIRQRIGAANRGKATYSDTNLREMRCFIGCHIMAGIRKDNHLNTTQMWSDTYGGFFYKSLFSLKRFEFLTRVIRFDDTETRGARLAEDRFALVRELWDAVLANSRANYTAGAVVTVDEQLLPFRGRCLFRVYISNKPAKYGIKIFMVCDADTLYCLHAIPYLGKGSINLPRGVNQGEFITMKLVGQLMDPGRVVCCDNWFTSLPLAKRLLAKKMHLVGTIRPKPYLPVSSIVDLKLGLKESVAVFNHIDKVNVVYKKVKPSKHVAVLTTLHNTFTYVENTKTEAHMFYNASKGGVDAFDMMCAASATNRKTRRWPMVVFYGLLNLVMNNAWIIYSSRDGHSHRNRIDFTTAMAFAMVKPYAVHRYETHHHYLSWNLKSLLKTMYIGQGDAVEPLPALMSTKKRQRCYLCDLKSNWRGKHVCHGQCGRNVCTQHSRHICQICWPH